MKLTVNKGTGTDGANKLIGADDAVGSNESVNYILLTKFSAVQTGNITRFKVKAGVTGNAKVAIYADSAGEPGTCLGYNNTSQGVVAGWNTLDIPTVHVVSGTSYWLGIIVDTTAAVLYTATGASSSNFRYKSATFSSFSWPSSAGGSYSSAAEIEFVAGWSDSTNVYLGTNVKDDFTDLRFTASGGSSTLPYWIESYTSGQSADVWVNFDSIGTGATTFYMYYGNSGASAQYATPLLAGKATFTLFDDFNDGSYDTATTWTTGGGTPAEGGGVLTVDSNGEYVYSKTNFGVNYSVRYQANHPDVESNWIGFNVAGSAPLALFERYPTSVWSARSYVSGSTDTSLDTAFLGSNQIYELARNNGTSNLYYVNNCLKGTHATQVTSSSLPVDIYMSATATMTVDWVLVRQYLNPEPTWGSWGSEDPQPTATPTPTATPAPTATPTPTPVPWYDSSWGYRKKITIAGTGSTLTDYQMMLTVNKGTGSDTGSTVYLANHALSWTGTVPNDIYFTKADGTSELKFWIETGTSTASTATVWIKFDSLPASASTNFYIYYGKSSATTTSNGASTFPDFFDDFPGTTLDTTTNWTVINNKGYSIASSILTENLGDGNPYGTLIESKTPFGVNKRFRALINYANNSAYATFGFSTSSGNIYANVFYANYPATNVLNGVNRNYYPSEGSANLGNIGYGQYYPFEIRRNSTTNSMFSVNNSAPTTLATYVPTGSLPVTLFAQGQIIYVDWVFVGNNTTTEPTWGSWGAEDPFPTPTPTPGPAINFEKVNMQGVNIN